MKESMFQIGDIVKLKEEFVPLHTEFDSNSAGVTSQMIESSRTNHPMTIEEFSPTGSGNVMLNNGYYYNPDWLQLVGEDEAIKERQKRKELVREIELLESEIEEKDKYLETTQYQLEEMNQLINKRDSELYHNQLEIEKWKERTKVWFNEAKYAWSRFHEINQELAEHQERHNYWKMKAREVELQEKIDG